MKTNTKFNKRIIEMNKSIFERYSFLKSLVKDRKEQFDRLISFMEKETAWLTAPASTKYHLCKRADFWSTRSMLLKLC